MLREIRPARDDEMDRVRFILGYSFNADRTPEAGKRLEHTRRMGPTTVLLDGGEIVATVRVFSLRMLVNGASVGMGGVSSVACLPEHRRRGHVGALLRHSLEAMRDDDQPLSTLFTPHPDLYRRSGWMYAAANVRYSWHPKHAAPWDKNPPSGRAERIGEQEQEELVSVYRRYTAGRTGYLDRSDTWWKEAVFRRLYDPERKPNDVALWRDERGEATGYVVYRTVHQEQAADKDIETLAVQEFVALSGDAYLGLLQYLFSHDLTGEVAWWGPVDSPLALALENSHFLNRRLDDGFMLRIVDVERAIAARPAAAGSPEGAFTIEVADAAAPWNQGTWLVECSGERLSARRTDDAAQIETDAASLAAIYSGHLRVMDAASAGLVRARDAKAAGLADRVLACDYPPFSPDFF